YIPAILIVVRAELPAQCRLLIKNHEQMDAKDCRRCYHYTDRTRASEHDPQPNPARRSTYENWVAHIFVKTDHHQPLGRGERCWASASRAGETPNAPKGHREAEH